MSQRTGRLYRLQGFGVVTPQATPSAGRPVSFWAKSRLAFRGPLVRSEVSSRPARSSRGPRCPSDHPRRRVHSMRLAPLRTSLMLALALTAGVAVAHAVPIGDLHQNTSSGTPALPYTPGT